jgi:hypothetical protein
MIRTFWVRLFHVVTKPINITLNGTLHVSDAQNAIFTIYYKSKKKTLHHVSVGYFEDNFMFPFFTLWLLFAFNYERLMSRGHTHEQRNNQPIFFSAEKWTF